MVNHNPRVKLYGPSESVQVRKCVAVANVAKAEFGHSHSKPGDDAKSTFAMVSPLNIYPALYTPNGVIVGSNAICDFFANTAPLMSLTGKDIYENAMIKGTVETCANVLEVALFKKTELGLDSSGEIAKYLEVLEAKLEKKTFLVGERKTYADITTAIVVKSVEKSGTKLPVSVVRWLNTIMADPKVSKAMNTKASTGGVSPKKKAIGGKVAASDAPTTSDAPAAAVSDAPAAPTVSEVPAAPVAATSDFNMGLPSLKKIDGASYNQNPAEAAKVSEGGINLEAWKRDYSNSKTEEDYAAAFAKFWEQFSAEDYTLWKMTYDKVEGECEKDYLTSNLLNGFIQRMDPSARKFGFGVCHVLGAEGCYDYEGMFMFRGTEMPKFMLDHPSFEYHFFAKVDPTDEEHKQLVYDFWVNEDTILGRKICDSKQFK